MNNTEFNQIYQNGLTRTQKQVLNCFLAGQTDQEILEEIQASDRTVIIKHIKNICHKFGLKESSNWRDSLLELFIKYHQSHLINSQLLKNHGFAPISHLPGGVEPPNSPYYIERENCESRCYEEMTNPGVLIKIKSPKQMGKTSLIKRIIKEAENHNYYVVELNLKLIDREKLTNIYTFLRGFYAYFASELELAAKLKTWDQDLSITVQCTNQMKQTLKNLDNNLILILDEVDVLFPFPEIYQNFFPMLRVWFENTRCEELWEKLRLIIAYSTEDYGKLDVSQSPFKNVGSTIKLEEFTLEEVRKLAFNHNIKIADAQAIMKMIGGHPYLIRIAFHNLYHNLVTINDLLTNWETIKKIYHDHLEAILLILEKEPELLIAFKQILNHTFDPSKSTEKIIYQLEGLGLIKILGKEIKIRCKLYQLYFSDRLK